MKKYLSCYRKTGAGLLLAPLVFLPGIQAEEKKEDDPPRPPGATLETYVVTPTKFAADLLDVGSSVTLLPAERLERRQIDRVEEALNLVPGAITDSSGNPGSISAIRMRGTESDHTQFIVDGIRISDSNILPDQFLGAIRAHHLDRIEVLRGPQSALYGGEAIGGVVSLWSPRGSGAPSVTLDTEAGTFATFESRIASDGELGDLDYSFSTGHLTTENDRPNNGFEHFFYAGRFDYTLNERFEIGMTVRGSERDLGVPGDKFTNDPNDFQENRFLLLTAYLDAQLTDAWNSHVVAGWLDQEQLFVTPANPPAPGPPPSSFSENEKFIVDWRNILEWEAGHTTLIGAGYEDTEFINTGFGSIDETDSLLSFYGQQTFEIGEALTLTGGARWEEYDRVGSVWTWRGTAAYHVETTGTIFRGSVGKGFKPPAFLDLFGTGFGFTGNPGLRPEESLGWDIGVEQRFGESTTASVTYFENDIEDLITFVFFPAFTTVNVGEAKTEGVEFALRSECGERVRAQLAYTYLEATDEATGDRLLRRPRHTLGFDINADAIPDKLTVGVGGYWVVDRLDTQPVFPFGTIGGEDYFVARLYGNLKVNEYADVHLRIENAFDEEYDEVAGFPARGFGIFGGLKVKF